MDTGGSSNKKLVRAFFRALSKSVTNAGGIPLGVTLLDLDRPLRNAISAMDTVVRGKVRNGREERKCPRCACPSTTTFPNGQFCPEPPRNTSPYLVPERLGPVFRRKADLDDCAAETEGVDFSSVLQLFDLRRH
jgi:hypothetical protein